MSTFDFQFALPSPIIESPGVPGRLGATSTISNSIQTSSEGLKTFGGQEFHSDQIKKILRCERARAQIR